MEVVHDVVGRRQCMVGDPSTRLWADGDGMVVVVRSVATVVWSVMLLYFC